MHSIADASGLNYETDFYGLGNATDLASWRTDNSTMYDFFVANQNVSQVGIIFTGPYVNPWAQGEDISNELGYWFYYNQTLPGHAQSTLLAIEQQISNQLLHRNSSASAKQQRVFSDEHIETLQKSLNDNAVLDGFERAFRQVEPRLFDSVMFKDEHKEHDEKEAEIPYETLVSEMISKREAWLEHMSTQAESETHEFQQAKDREEAKTLLETLVKAVNFTYSISLKDFPITLLRFSQLSIANQSGGTLYFIPPMIVFFVLLTDIVAEKESKLRVGMKMMGLSNAAYWASWYTHGIIMVFLVTGIQYLAGLACGYTFFTHSNAFSVLSLFWTFGLAMIAVAFFLSTVIASSKTAQTVGYAIILVGFVFQSVLNSLNGLLVDFMWLRDAATWIVAVRYLLSSYPPFNLAKAWSDISSLSSAVPSFSSGTIVDGPGFYWADMYKYRVVLDTKNLYVASPPPANSYYTLLINIAVFGILAWYLDNVLPGEHGSPRPFYFLFTREYWGFRKKKKIPANATTKANGRFAGDDLMTGSINGGEEYDSDVEAEQQVALQGDADDDEDVYGSRPAKAPASKWAVRLQNISKLYRKWSCCRSDTDTFAVNDVSVTIERGELFTLLGHNGAGKTTLISMLTGLFKPTSGIATIYGLDLEEDAVRSVIGVCPQHDVLWPELTAREHLLLFSRVKGIPSYLIDAEVHEKLELVGLTHVANEPAGSFSGGMKRRLSVAVSCIGDPKLIFLDEPSSGLDPVNKRKIWRMIEGLKRNRAIVLTTHSMEEAEVLSDRLAIMAYGKIRAIGDSLHLKSKYGDGYRVSIVVDVPTDTPKEDSPATHLFNEIIAKWNDVKLISNDSGMLLIGCPKSFQEEMPLLLDFVMADSRVKEWGLSHSTLESVFLAVTKKHNFVYEDIESDDEIPDLPVGDAPQGSHSASRVSNGAPNHSMDDDEDDIEAATANTRLLAGSRPETRKSASHQHHQKGHTSHGRKQLKSHPMRALVRKNLTLQWRQRFSTCCQLVTPILIILILFILKVIIKSQLGPTMSAPHVYPGQPIPLNGPASLGQPMNDRAYTFYFAYSDPTGNAGTLFVNGSGSGMLGYLPQYNNTWSRLKSGPHVPMTFSPNHVPAPVTPPRTDSPASEPSPTTTPDDASPDSTPNNSSSQAPYRYEYFGGMMPYFNLYKDESSIQSAIYDNFTQMNQIPMKQVRESPTSERVPDAYAAFHKIDAENLKLDVTLAVNTNPVQDYHRRNGFTRLSYAPSFYLKPATNLLPRSLNFQNGFWTSMTMMTRSFTAYVLGLAGISVEPYLRAYNTIVTQPMPTWSEDNIWAFLELAGTLLYPLGLTLQIPLYMYLLTLEKSEKLREMMLSHGLRTRYYHIVNYIFFYTIYALTAALFWLAGIASSSRFFMSTHWSVLLLFFLGWGFALVSLASFVSAFLNSPRVATVAGYVIALFGTALAFVVAVGIYGPSPLSLNTPYPTWTFIWPQFSFMRGMYLLNDACALQGLCYGPITHLRWSDEFAKCLLALYLAGILFYVLFLYLDAVLPREYGIPKHPLFFLPCFGRSKKPVKSSTPRAALHTMSARGSSNSLSSSRKTADSSHTISIDGEESSRTTGEHGHGPSRKTGASSSIPPRGSRASRTDYESDYNSDIDDTEAVVAPLSHHGSMKQVKPLASSGSNFVWDSNADEDVAIEAVRVMNGSYPPNSPLVCQELRKVYDSGKVAVKGLHLAVAENECFGLLGENGAGKSTTLSMLTGMFKPSDGTALVGGYDIRTEIDQVHLSMGLCPQFDILWNDLTVKEHLLFYARLKGIDSSEEDDHVDRLITEVGLAKAKNKRADALSGGMRRRLSIAMALVGDSRIVFLDEPTTGLDAASRRQIWAIVRRAKRGRAIILTTHSMDEAELLCSRIGILAHGQLRCLGNQQHLKSLFGEGVRLKINYGQTKSGPNKSAVVQHQEPESLDTNDDDEVRFNANRHASPPPKNDAESRAGVVGFVMQQFPDANVAGDFHGTIEFLLSTATPISHIFRTMETLAPKGLISDWAVSQIGLEDVFQTVVAQAEQEVDAPTEPYDAV